MRHPHRLFSSLTLSFTCAALMLAVAPSRDLIAQALPADYARAWSIIRAPDGAETLDSLTNLAIGDLRKVIVYGDAGVRVRD